MLQKEDGTTEKRTLHPRHVIQATGHSGEMSFPQIKGMEDFKGDRLCHSSQFKGANSESQGKKAIVVGCCNSGHDIAQDFFEHGYDVTIVQRSSTYVMSSKAGLDVLLGGLVGLPQPIFSLFKQIGSTETMFWCSRAPPERTMTDLEKYNSTKKVVPIPKVGLPQPIFSLFKQIGSTETMFRCSRAPPKRTLTDLEKYNRRRPYVHEHSKRHAKTHARRCHQGDCTEGRRSTCRPRKGGLQA